MRRIIQTALEVLLLLALVPGMLLGAGMALPTIYGDSYYAELGAMDDRLLTAEGQRLILIGGSNVAFGVDTALLEELLYREGFSYTVCPYGLYAAVGSSAMLELAQDTLREGDVVVLALEPVSEAMSTYFGATAFWKCAEEHPNLLLRLNREQSAALWGNYVSYLQERLEICRTGELPRVEGIYARASFDDTCNLTASRPGNIMALGFDASEPVDLAAVSIQPEFADEVNTFCQTAERQGAAVYLSFSPVNHSALTDSSEESAYAFFQNCLDAFSCGVISDPNRYILDSGWFYDSNFHMNSAGAILRTTLLAEDLLAQFGCHRQPEVSIPEMPPSAAVLGENYADPSLFLYTPSGEGYLISGLTKEGKETATLVLPTVYQGKPVAGLTPEALAGARSLEELWVPQSIESLPGQLFTDCPLLIRLVLEHTTYPCGIQEDTFAGAQQVRVYIPAEAYTLYRDGYGCETNGWERELDRIQIF